MPVLDFLGVDSEARFFLLVLEPDLGIDLNLLGNGFDYPADLEWYVLP